MLARIESIKPAATHPLHATYAAMAGALQIRLGQHREGAARLVAALPEAEEQVRPVLLAVLALADLEAGHAGAARQSLDQARMQLKQQSSVWYQTCASLLIDEVTRRLPKD
jgi:predicted Zn-dependent protease